LALWLQIHTDLLKKPIQLPREMESCALGSSHGRCAGVYSDFGEAASAMVAIDREVEPNLVNSGVYDELFGRYVDLYSRLNS
jgi:sugar (pentulose or hexulose) kinase